MTCYWSSEADIRVNVLMPTIQDMGTKRLCGALPMIDYERGLELSRGNA